MSITPIRIKKQAPIKIAITLISPMVPGILPLAMATMSTTSPALSLARGVASDTPSTAKLVMMDAKEITRKYGPILEEIDLTYTQYIVMMYFWEKGESNVKEISKTLLLDPSTLTPLLKKLEEKGFLTRERSNTDERNLVVKLTDKGLNLREKAVEVPAKIGKCLNLTDEEAKTLYNLSYKVLRNIEKENHND